MRIRDKIDERENTEYRRNEGEKERKRERGGREGDIHGIWDIEKHEQMNR